MIEPLHLIITIYLVREIVGLVSVYMNRPLPVPERHQKYKGKKLSSKVVFRFISI